LLFSRCSPQGAADARENMNPLGRMIFYPELQKILARIPRYALKIFCTSSSKNPSVAKR
jgi:hypothetical protein